MYIYIYLYIENRNANILYLSKYGTNLDTMDEDVREALVNDEAFEELCDDFVLQAAGAIKANDHDDEEAETKDVPSFDYDAHIQSLLMQHSLHHHPASRLSCAQDDSYEDSYEEEADSYEEADSSTREEKKMMKKKTKQENAGLELEDDVALETLLASEYTEDDIGDLTSTIER
jgi:protein LTV1